MALAKDYNSVMARSEEIMKKTLGLDYSQFESGSIAFDYEGLMDAAASVYSLDDVLKMQKEIGAGTVDPGKQMIGAGPLIVIDTDVVGATRSKPS